MKLLARAVLFAELLVVAINVSGQPNQAANDKHKPTQESGQTVTANDAQHHYDSAEERQRTGDQKPLKWYTSLKRADWWLVIAAFATLGVVCWQAVASAAATKAMRKSVALQEVGLRQWVDIEEWGVAPEKYVEERMRPGSITLNITFHIVNHTKIPLTICGITSKVGSQTLDVREKDVLAPDNSYPVIVPMVLTGEQITEYFANKFLFSIRGFVIYLDALETERQQTFGQLGTCGPSGYHFLAYQGKQPKTRQGDDKTN